MSSSNIRNKKVE